MNLFLHNITIRKLTSPLLISVLAFLAACDDNDGKDTPHNAPENEAIIYTGVFIDSPVEGLEYQTATQSGTTNSDGEFLYQADESVTFSIGGIEFPTTAAASKISPLTVFSTSSYSHVGVVNMVRLLQTLDLDGIPENGIELATNIHTLAANLTVDFTSENFDAEIATLISTNVSSNNATNSELVSESIAIAHLKTSLGDTSSNNCMSTHGKVGFTSSFSTLQHNVTGDAEILDDCTIEISNFNYDSTAPAVYFYGSLNTDFSNGFIIGEQLRDDGSDYINDTIKITLPEGKTLSDLDHLSVWCVDFAVNFGDLTFSAP